ncbi:MAG TPA: hypothetical protein VMI32_06645 [Candidatus Solibacter sp.]|nr:hypothetical protein [Candidatus Solibacter sp.]
MDYIFVGASVAAVVLLALGLGVGLTRAVRAYMKYRGKRIVSCPETHHAAAVRVAAGDAALHATIGEAELRLKECSRWPEREACGQLCLQQIEEAPNACLVSTIVNHWYTGKECAYCHKPFGELHWELHHPALVSPEGKTVQWNEVPAEKLQDTMKTHQPVCWDCHIAETFRREHPEMVVDRVEDPLRMSIYK